MQKYETLKNIPGIPQQNPISTWKLSTRGGRLQAEQRMDYFQEMVIVYGATARVS